MTTRYSGVDVGGTFTDVVVWDGDSLHTGKVPSTPDQSDGVLDGLEAVAGAEVGRLVHGTTAATNALLERRGARTALVTDAGFEDLLEIGRQDRPSLYDTSVTRTLPLVDRPLRFGLAGRAEHGVSQTESGVDAELLASIAEAAPEAVAISLLYSFEDDRRERAVESAIEAALPDVRVSRSSGVVAEFREFERTSTTVVNAYLAPEVARYLHRLADRLTEAGVDGSPTVMRSSGGLIPIASAAALPASILLSGPAGGVIAATAVGTALGHERVISFDMGGTSTDVCRIDFGRPEIGYERPIDGLPVRMPSVAIHTVGAGGGSVGWVDAGGALRVGPRSAGAYPGPASYGRGGTRPAVTDANVLLGRIGPQSRLGGSVRLDLAAATAALASVGNDIGLDAITTARGMIEIVEAHMLRAIRAVSVEQGADPRKAVLVAFGGAGALHATALARGLDMAGVVVPAHAGVFSALGLLLAPPRADAARSVLLRSGDTGLDAAVAEIASQAAGSLREGSTEPTNVHTVADVRYLGQSHETGVAYAVGEGWDALADRFHAAHRTRNGFARPHDPIEVVTVRAEATGDPAVRWDDLPTPRPSGEPRRADRTVVTAADEVIATCWWRPALSPETRLDGPAVIEEPEATTYVGPGEQAVVHDNGALVISW